MNRHGPATGGRLQTAFDDMLASYQQNEIIRGLTNGAPIQQALPVFLGEAPSTNTSGPVPVLAEGSDAIPSRSTSSMLFDGRDGTISAAAPGNTSFEKQTSSPSGNSGTNSSSPGKEEGKTSTLSGSVRGSTPMKHRQYSQMMRANLASETAAVRMLAALSRARQNRPDIQFLKVSV